MPSRFRLSLLLALLISGLYSCGVKKPPLAPQRQKDPGSISHLDCSPKDPDCDKTDPNYQPVGR